MSPDVTERKNFALDEFKARRGDVQNKARLVNEQLFIKGKLQTKYQALKPLKVCEQFGFINHLSLVLLILISFDTKYDKCGM